MSHDLESVAATIGGSGQSAAVQLKHLFIASALTIVLTACGFLAERDVRAYNACMSRHPQEAPLCEGPSQAYEVDTATFQARAAAYSLSAGSSYEELPAAAHPALTPVPLRAAAP
jgi:hypothetical protein